MMQKVCIAGGTGWAGSALSRGVFEVSDMELVAVISRSQAGKSLGKALDIDGLTVPIFASADEALETGPDVFVDYTKPDVAKSNVCLPLEAAPMSLLVRPVWMRLITTRSVL